MSRLDPSVRDYFAQQRDVSEWWTPDQGTMRFHYDCELQIIRDCLRIDPDWRVLDVGTGRGRFGSYFATQGCRVLGVDLNSDMLAIAEETGRQLGVSDRFELRRASAEDLSICDDATFDVVLMMELFDHLPKLDRALAEVRRKLKPGGCLLFTYVPSESIYGTIGNVYRWLRGKFSPVDPMISRTYSFAEVSAVLGSQGFELERYWGVGVLCVSAQTRLFQENFIVRGLTAIARAEARRWPYYETPLLARRGAHVVGLARVTVTT